MPMASLQPNPTAPNKTVPRAPFHSVPSGATNPGISHYDWLAAVAMQGLVTHGMEVRGDRALSEEDKDREMAERAYRMADAMLRAREKTLSTSK